MDKQIQYFQNYPLHFGVLISTIFPIIILLMRRDESKSLRIFFYYLIVKLIIDIITDIYSANRINNIAYNNLWLIVSFWIVSYYFYNVFFDLGYKKYIKYCGVIFTIIFFIDLAICNLDSLTSSDIKFVLYASPIKCIIICSYCFLFLYELIEEVYLAELTRSSHFCIVCGLLAYNCSSMFTSALYNMYFTWDNHEALYFVCHIPYYFEIVLMIIVSIGFIRSKNTLES